MPKSRIGDLLLGRGVDRSGDVLTISN